MSRWRGLEGTDLNGFPPVAQIQVAQLRKTVSAFAWSLGLNQQWRVLGLAVNHVKAGMGSSYENERFLLSLIRLSG